MAENKVQVLDDQVIGKISAGEVVEKPASVVKELMENALDAGADSIDIEIENSGKTLIRIADNGEGMSAGDARLSCMRHATSKLRDIEDLESLKTLGFRGEALASISAVSVMEIITRSGDAPEGISLSLENGKVLRERPAGRVRGTTVEVRNIFYNVPARKKFLKKDSTELSAIVDIVGKYVISRAGTGFVLKQKGREIFNVPPDTDLLERIRVVMGNGTAGGMVGVDFSSGKYRIKGYVSRPACTRKDRNAQVFFVNDRFVRSKLISAALQDAYRSLLERGRYPLCVLFIDTDQKSVDVNIHPTKLLVKFQDEKELRETVITGIKEVFSVTKADGKIPYGDGHELNGAGRHETFKVPVYPEIPDEQKEFEYDRDFMKGLTYEKKGASPVAVPAKPHGGSGILESWNSVFQVGSCYIVQLKDDRIVVTDQHAAHERILYEHFSRRVDSMSGEVQNLLFPVKIDLSASESVVMNRIIGEFKILGFEIEPFGQNTFIIRSAPPILKDRDIKSVISDVLADMSEGRLAEMEVIDELVKVTSCRAAIKSGDRLTSDEMITLLEQLKRCELPFTCPHGRPTSFDITLDELEKRFRRK